MPAGRYDTFIEKGATFRRTFAYSTRPTPSTTEPVDLSTATVTMQIRSRKDNTLIIALTEGDGLTIDGPNGEVEVFISAIDTAAMTATTACGYILAAELRACGVDFSFTPVLDLDFGRSGVIGDRSFSSDPQIVYALAKALNAGLQLAGMANCGKHFPGHGWAEADSHVAIPVDERPLNAILQCDAKPYEWLDLSLAAVMPAHVIYPKVDSLPAGFSKTWLQTILRQQLAFEGVIFSDDLSMEGASVAGDVVKGAELALSAGCDAVLICNRPDLADRLLSELRVSKLKKAESAQRQAKLMPSAPFMNWTEMQAHAEYQHAQALLKRHGLI
jgi:beta-N-acetylhexosaminidase